MQGEWGSDESTSQAHELLGSTVIQIMSNNDNSINLLSFLEKEKLNQNNFLDWYHDLRIVLKQEGKELVLEAPISLLPENGGTIAEIMAEKNAREQSISVTCLMLITMNPNLQRQFENMDAYNIILKLKIMFQAQVRSKRIQTINAILDTRLEEGKPVGPHVRKMIGYFEIMERLGFPFALESATDIILHSLHDGFNQFRENFAMYEMEKPLIELLNMLQTFEQIIDIKPKMQCLMVRKGKGFKKNGAKKQWFKGKSRKVVKVIKPQATKKHASPSRSTCLYKEDEKNGCLNLPSNSGPKKN